ncbi:MAG: hypothetical protein AAGE80_06825 [Pseudomonadota bacterium]
MSYSGIEGYRYRRLRRRITRWVGRVFGLTVFTVTLTLGLFIIGQGA